MTDFANRLKLLRTENKLSQKALAEQLNVTQNAVFNWENGKREPNTEMIERIAAYFKVDPAYMIGWSRESYTLLKAYEDAEDDEKDGLVIAGTLVTEKNLLRQYNTLNRIGQAEAIKRVSELKYIPGYTGDNGIPFD